MRGSIFLTIAMVTLLGTLVPIATGQGIQAVPNQKITLKEAQAVMNATLEMKDFQIPMKLSECFEIVKSKMEAKGKKFPIHLDRNSFKMANPCTPRMEDTQVKFEHWGVKIATVKSLLECACSQVPTENAVFEFENGHFVITTGDPRKNATVGKGVLVDPTQQMTAGEAMHFLNTTLNMRDWQVPMRMSECLGLLREKFWAIDKKCPVLLDIMAFKKANPNDKWVFDVEIKLPANKKMMKIDEFLGNICSQLPGKNTKYQYNNGYFYIIPGK